MTERALKHRPAPEIFQPSDIRRAVAHAGGQQDPARGNLIATIQFEKERVVNGSPGDNAPRAEFDTGISRQLTAPHPIQLGRLALIVAQQPTYGASR